MGGLVEGEEGLVGFGGVLVVVGVALELEKDVIGETMRGVPAVPDVDFLVFSVVQLLPL